MAHTDQAENAIRYMQNKLLSVFNKTESKSGLNYLDVGCGYGGKTLPIIHVLEDVGIVNTIALDPSENLLSLFKAQKNNERIHFVCSTWEDYYPESTFNFISSIHTFYYIHDWKTAIEKMINSLDQGGIICIALRANDVVCQFRNYFYKKIYADNRTERNCDELCALLELLHIHYKIEFVESKLDVRDCLLQNAQGQQLIEFLLRFPYADISNQVKNEIHTYLEDAHQDGYLSQSDGYVWINLT